MGYLPVNTTMDRITLGVSNYTNRKTKYKFTNRMSGSSKKLRWWNGRRLENLTDRQEKGRGEGGRDREKGEERRINKVPTAQSRCFPLYLSPSLLPFIAASLSSPLFSLSHLPQGHRHERIVIFDLISTSNCILF